MAIGSVESEEYLGVIVGIEYITNRLFSEHTCLRWRVRNGWKNDRQHD